MTRTLKLEGVISPAGEWLEFHEASEPYCTNIAFAGAGMRKA